MSYGFHSGRQSRSRRQPKYNDDIVDALNHALSSPKNGKWRGRDVLPKFLQQRMPVNVSNGEYEFAPEEVYAIGLHMLAALRQGKRPGFNKGSNPEPPVAPGQDEKGSAKNPFPNVGGMIVDGEGLRDAIKERDYESAAKHGTALADSISEMGSSNVAKRIGLVPAAFKSALDFRDAYHHVVNGDYSKLGDDGGALVQDVGNVLSRAGAGFGTKIKDIGGYLQGAGQIPEGIYQIAKGDVADGGRNVLDGVEKLGKKIPLVQGLNAVDNIIQGAGNMGKGQWAAAADKLTKAYGPTLATAEALIPEGLPLAGEGAAGAISVGGAPLVLATLGSLAAGGAGGYLLYNHTPYGPMLGGWHDGLTNQIKNRYGVLTAQQKNEISNKVSNEKIAAERSAKGLPPLVMSDANPDPESGASWGRRTGLGLASLADKIFTPADQTDAYKKAVEQYENSLRMKENTNAPYEPEKILSPDLENASELYGYNSPNKFKKEDEIMYPGHLTDANDRYNHAMKGVFYPGQSFTESGNAGLHRLGNSPEALAAMQDKIRQQTGRNDIYVRRDKDNHISFSDDTRY